MAPDEVEPAQRSAILRTPMPGYGTFDEVLPPEESSAILEWVLASESALKPSTRIDGVLDLAFRTSRSMPRSLNGASLEPLRRRVGELFPQLLRVTNSRTFELAEIDLKLVAYGEGDFIAPHSDTAVGAYRCETDRVLSAIYYFHREPKGYSGGELRLYPFGSSGAESDPFVEMTPRHNSLTVFPAWTTHSVNPVRCPSGRFADSRFAVNCWLNRRSRSA